MTTFRSAAARLAGRALAMAPRALDALLAAGEPPEARRAALPLFPDAVAAPRRRYTLMDSGIAVVPIIGPLVARPDWLSAFFGATGYGEVGDAVEAAFADPSARAVLLEIDSPGGEAGGLFDLVDRVAALGDGAGKPLWAVANESALSAAYAIASVVERLYVTRTAEVGSVGVVAIHVDESAADAMAGLKWTLIHAGARKIDGNPHQPLSGSAFADIQADVDALHGDLVALVAANRGMAPEKIHATEAAIYRGQRGIDAGFADRIGTVERALTDLASELDAARTRATAPRRIPVASLPAEALAKAGSPQPRRSKPKMTTDTDIPAGEAPDHEPEHIPDPAPTPAPATPEPPPAPAPATPGPTPPAAPAAAATTAALRAEYAEIAAVAAQASRLGVALDAAEAMRTGVKPDALRRSVLDALAARAEATGVVATAPAPATAADSPIVRRARERAAASTA